MAVKLAHISDLHFDVTKTIDSAHRHSPDHLMAMSSALANGRYDRIIVSGDVTNTGDTASFAQARQFLLDKIEHNGSHFGLQLGTTDKLVIVPGNHDAFNCVGTSSIWTLWQKSTKHYHDAFPEKPLEHPFGAAYDWIETPDGCVFIAYADSCYMGDANSRLDCNPFRSARRAARGDLSIEQSAELKRFYEDGVRGQLPLPDASAVIAKEKFAAALKLLVMHHYIFSPPGIKRDLFMRLRQKRKVILSLALADFDAVLCGHSHIAHTHQTTYGENLDRRGRRRYMLAYAKRILGIDDYPRVLGGRNDRYALSSWASFVVNVFVKYVFLREPDRTIEDAGKQVLADLLASLDSRKAFRQSFRERVAALSDSGERTIAGQQLQRLQRDLVAALSTGDRSKLASMSAIVPELLRALKQRTIVQLMSGSSGKAMAPKSSVRSFAEYEFIRTAHGWQMSTTRFAWDDEQKSFLRGRPRATVRLEASRRPVPPQ